MSWQDLAAVIGNAPDLRGAACRGRSELFDVDGSHDYTQAIAICHQCPALLACQHWIDSLGPRSKRKPSGIVAGRLIGTGTGRPGRPPQHRPAA